ncbi:MAG: septal ring lytic transglycosylase RlpA family protein [Micromonosporaceae bacterium]
MPGKHAASRLSRYRIAALASAFTLLAAGSGIALESYQPASGEPQTAPPPRTTERVSRDERPPHRTPTPSATPRKPAPRVIDHGACGTSFYDEPQGTANGEQFNPNAITAAHKSLPFNTRVRVTNPANGRSVVVRINDRGPYIGGRCLDLSRAAYARIASLNSGVIHAEYEVLAG